MTRMNLQQYITNAIEGIKIELERMSLDQLAGLDQPQYVSARRSKWELGNIQFDKRRATTYERGVDGRIYISLPVVPSATVQILENFKLEGSSTPIHEAYSSAKFDANSGYLVFTCRDDAQVIKSSESLIREHYEKLGPELKRASDDLAARIPGFVAGYVERAKAELARRDQVAADAGIVIVDRTRSQTRG